MVYMDADLKDITLMMSLSECTQMIIAVTEKGEPMNSKNIMPDELLTPDERADVLNAINEAL